MREDQADRIIELLEDIRRCVMVNLPFIRDPATNELINWEELMRRYPMFKPET